MDFLKLAKKRYACRKYLSRQVEPEKLELILEAGRVAPTGANRQPQRLVVVQSKEGMERLARFQRRGDQGLYDAHGRHGREDCH